MNNFLARRTSREIFNSSRARSRKRLRKRQSRMVTARSSEHTLWREILLKKPLAESLTLYSLSRRLRFSSKNKRCARACTTPKPVLWLHLRGIRRDCRRVKRVKQSRLCVRVSKGRTRSVLSGANSPSGTTKLAELPNVQIYDWTSQIILFSCTRLQCRYNAWYKIVGFENKNKSWKWK